MSDLWEQAQSAISAGNTRDAHVLLARLLQKEPKNADAWYLLSTISVDNEQETLFLQKVLKIDPAHDQARARLASLAAEPATPPAPASLDRGDFEAQSEGDTLPAWMVGEAHSQAEETNSPAGSGQLAAEPLPDRLEGETPLPLPPAGQPAAGQPPEPAPMPASRPPRRKAQATLPALSPLLIGLVVAATIVAILLLWAIIRLGPTLF